MKHYLMKIIENPELADPVKNAPDVHKHFTRYSKGVFDGPIFKVSQTKSKISIWCSYEYEDVATRLALENLPEDIVSVKGSVMSASDFTKLMEKIGFDSSWKPIKSKGKSVNYSIVHKTAKEVSKEQLIALSSKAVPYLYSFLSFSSEDKSTILAIKTKPPRPSNKNPDEAAIGNKIKFCTLKLANSPEIAEKIIDAIAIDFKDEIPKNWKSIIIQNNYEITDLILPEKDPKMSSRVFRLKTLRKGKLNRIAEINKETFTNTVNFTA